MGLIPGTPHRLMEDDVYKGRLIPAGTTVMDNTWYGTRFLEAISADKLNTEKGDFS